MLAGLLPLAALAVAAPVIERGSSAPTDTEILNYALTLEHLENSFYKAGVANFTLADFRKVGTGSRFYAKLESVASDEQTHVDFLTNALGESATQPCEYAFPVTDAKSFLQVAAILEGVGVSAYLGAAQYITEKAYLTAAGAILTVEARHSALLRQANRASSFPSPFDIPLDFSEVYSLAAQFITSCPSPNGDLPQLQQFPAIAVSPATPAVVGDKVTLTVSKSVNAVAAYFITILGPVKADLTGSGSSYTITVPEGVQQGQEYVVLTSEAADPTDDNIVAGPAIVMIEDAIQEQFNKKSS